MKFHIAKSRKQLFRYISSLISAEEMCFVLCGYNYRCLNFLKYYNNVSFIETKQQRYLTCGPEITGRHNTITTEAKYCWDHIEWFIRVAYFVNYIAYHSMHATIHTRMQAHTYTHIHTYIDLHMTWYKNCKIIIHLKVCDMSKKWLTPCLLHKHTIWCWLLVCVSIVQVPGLSLCGWWGYICVCLCVGVCVHACVSVCARRQLVANHGWTNRRNKTTRHLQCI